MIQEARGRLGRKKAGTKRFIRELGTLEDLKSVDGEGGGTASISRWTLRFSARRIIHT